MLSDSTEPLLLASKKIGHSSTDHQEATVDEEDSNNVAAINHVGVAHLSEDQAAVECVADSAFIKAATNCFLDRLNLFYHPQKFIKIKKISNKKLNLRNSSE